MITIASGPDSLGCAAVVLSSPCQAQWLQESDYTAMLAILELFQGQSP